MTFVYFMLMPINDFKCCGASSLFPAICKPNCDSSSASNSKHISELRYDCVKVG
jgi:hypothetical protein